MSVRCELRIMIHEQWADEANFVELICQPSFEAGSDIENSTVLDHGNNHSMQRRPHKWQAWQYICYTCKQGPVHVNDS